MPSTAISGKNLYFAKFATASRLVACLVIEGLVDAFYIPSTWQDDTTHCTGVGVLLRQCDAHATHLSPHDVLAIIPLRGCPILAESTILLNGVHCTKIDLIDGLDMLPCILGPVALLSPSSFALTDDTESDMTETMHVLHKTIFPGLQPKTFVECGPVQLWRLFATDIGVDPSLTESIGEELASSVLHQVYQYDHPKPLPSLASSSVAWEQAIFEGHATHPMHKARKSFPPMPQLLPDSVDWEQPRLRLVALPSGAVQLRGDFCDLTRPVVNAMLAKTHATREQFPGQVFFPVHELQVPNILSRFPDATVLPAENSVVANSLASTRSVVLPDLLPGLSLKLCLGVKISSALRTITPFSTHFGPGFSFDVVPHLTYDRNVLTVQRELASAIYKHDDFDVAKHCSCVVRESTEHDPATSNTDLIVPCAALVEKIQRPDTDETLVTHVWGLHSDEKRVAFLATYIDLALRAFLPPALVNGVAFEAHGQNTLARFDRATGELKGFVIRDFGGVKVHRPTLQTSCGVDIDVLPDSCVVAEQLDEVYKLLYHTLIYSHLQRLIRVLTLHDDGRGWEILRSAMETQVPRDHPMWTMLMASPTVPGKCLVRMKIEELYRDYIYSPVPNLIHHKAPRRPDAPLV